VDIVLGLNGGIWIYTAQEDNQEVSVNVREKICRVRNCILSLSKTFSLIYPESIASLYELTLNRNIAAKDILHIEITDE